MSLKSVCTYIINLISILTNSPRRSRIHYLFLKCVTPALAHLRMSISSFRAWASCARLVSSSLRCCSSATSRSRTSARTPMSSLQFSSLRHTQVHEKQNKNKHLNLISNHTMFNKYDFLYKTEFEFQTFSCFPLFTCNSPPEAAPSDSAAAAASCRWWWWRRHPESRSDSASPSVNRSQPVATTSPPHPATAVMGAEKEHKHTKRGVKAWHVNSNYCDNLTKQTNTHPREKYRD